MKLKDIMLSPLEALYAAKIKIDEAIKVIENTMEDKSDSIRNAIIDIVLHNVCIYFGVTRNDMEGKTRQREIVQARHCYFAISKDFLPHDISLASIGSYTNNDHATVIHGIRKINEAKDVKDVLYYDYLNIKDKVQNAIDRLVFLEDKEENSDK